MPGSGVRSRKGGAKAPHLRSTFLLLAVVLAAGGLRPAPALAQGHPQGTQDRWSASVVGGVHGTDPEVHLFGGIEAGARARGRLGINALGLRGAGRGYTSSLLAVGPSVRFPLGPVADGRRAALEAWAAPAWYGETVEAPGSLVGGLGSAPSEVSRSTPAGLAGVALRVPVWRGSLSAGLIHWRGSLSGDGFASSGGFSGTRFIVGIGR